MGISGRTTWLFFQVPANLLTASVFTTRMGLLSPLAWTVTVVSTPAKRIDAEGEVSEGLLLLPLIRMLVITLDPSI